ncbi:MAG: DNA methyltransferase, partial [Nitrospiria bacterium]
DEQFKALFDFLARYNFTIAESTPLDQDVDIDPEMLGKVFENLLAAEERHGSGTYYTPRTIVEFMCRESLFHHVSAQTGIERGGFDDLFEAPLEGRLPAVEKDLAREIQSRIRDLKVLDPAVGSGAFLLGMLHELIQLRSVCGRVLGESEAVQAGLLGDWKREIIGNNLFGVDLNAEACEIARLRLWLSMVVDESEPSPLPNLDYRIVEGNTLREKLDGAPILPPRSDPGFEREDDLFKTEKPQGKLYLSERDTRTASIVQHLAAYYRTHADAEKRHLRKSIAQDLEAILAEHWRGHEERWRREESQVLDKALQMHKKPDDLPRDWAAKLAEAKAHLDRIGAEREALRKTGTWPVTPLRLFFAEAFAGNPGGFDIVIANPPYVRQELIRKDKPHLQEEFGEFFASTADLYTYFYARGLDLLRPGGVLCFIAPNKFMRAGYGKNTRKLLTSGATPRLILDFGDLPIFEATTYPSVVLVEKKAAAEADEAVAAVLNDPQHIEEVAQAVAEIGFPMPIKSLSEDGWTLERPDVLKLMAKLREKGVPLGQYVSGKFYRGILTGFNEAFVIDEATRKRLIKEDSKSKEIIKPWLRGRDIKKWRAEWAGLYVIAIASSANKKWPWSGSANAEKIFAKTYPAICAHL